MNRALLKTDRVLLRRLERTDLSRCHDWINRPEVFSIMGVFGPRSSEEQNRWYDSVLASRSNLVFAICLIADGRHIGNGSLFDIDSINRHAGLTVFLPERDDQGKGYGRDAVALLCDYAFRYLNLHRVYCKTHVSAAARVYERLGFRSEGVLRQHSFCDGQYVDKQIFGVLSSEFIWPHP